MTAADGVITGVGQINGRFACIVAEDFTVMGGTFGLIHGKKKARAVEIANRDRLPIVWLLDGAGARAQEMIGEGLPEGPHLLDLARHSGLAPQIALVMGPSAGESSILASLCEFIVMVDGTSMLAAGGPPVVKAATGQDIHKDALGGPSIHCRVSGLADMRASNDAHAIEIAKAYLSYLPSNSYNWPPAYSCNDPVDRADEALLTLVPEDSRQTYDMKPVLRSVFDRDSFFEIGAEHAEMLIVGFARLDGHPVGVVANQTLVQAGAITAAAARKGRRFIDLCTAYHLPLIFFVDVPGVMPGPQAEKEGTLRPGLSLTYALAWSDVPRISVVLRKAFGYGGLAMGGGGNAGQTLVLAWPGAILGSLPAPSSVLAAHAEEIKAAADPEALKQKLLDRYSQCTGPFHAAAKANIDDVIDPRETRQRIIAALARTRAHRSPNPEPVYRRGIMP